uniref:Response regulatory domain-containing protein n=1 Tax=Thermosporothrix sp. COM3 TaxID=2490863 RepID=A0A455SPM7_9CHLR|nr:hypothetical protein KTC_37000 [Thermosporothrix sp. COM3]
MRIAVIENELSIQDMLRYALELEGHRVDIYACIPDQFLKCDLVIIEPGEYGQHFQVVLHCIEYYRVPVVILTFYDWNIIMAQEYGVPALRKLPFRLSLFLEYVNMFQDSTVSRLKVG